MIEWSRADAGNNMSIDMHNLDEEEMRKIRENCNYHTTLTKKDFDDTFCVLHMNVRSMKNKMDEIITFLSKSDIQWDVICISETWLKGKMTVVKYYDLEQYKLFANCRSSGEGGGTAIYIHTKHQVEERSDLGNDDIEATIVQINVKTKSGNKNIFVGAIYRPPNSVNSCFLMNMEKILSTIEDEKKLTILAGDFNYNLLPAHTDRCTIDFSNLMTSYGLFR